MDISQFCLQLDELFELDEGTIQSTDELQQVPGWSSLTFMGLIALVDEEYGVSLRPAAVLKARTITDLFALVVPGTDEVAQAA